MQEPMENVLGDRYEIIDLIGEGGMAEVYKARHIQLNRLVAIKVMHRFLARDDGFRARFEREAQLGARLRHPNIVEVFDYAAQENKKIYYIVVEYIDGPSLARYLDNLASTNDRMPADEFLRVSRDIASALSYAHSQGMIHRDVKASNVLLEHGYRVVLTDFGMAKMITQTPGSGQLTASNTMLGTPAYMSPEQALGEPGEGSSDIYSLGILMYQMATGQLPFDAESPVALALKHVNEMPVEPNEIDPYIPSQLNNIIMRCLMKDPGARYQRANDLVDELDDIAMNDILGTNTLPQGIRNTVVPPLPLGNPEPRKPVKPSLSTSSKTISLKTTPPSRNPRRRNHSVLVGFSVLIPLLVLGALLSTGSGVFKSSVPGPTQITTVQLENRVATTAFDSTQIAAQIRDAVQATQGANNSTQIASISTRGAQNATLLAGYATELASTAVYLANHSNGEKTLIPSATPMPCSAAAAANTGANVRTGPGLNYYAFGMLGINSSVPVLGYADEIGSKVRWWQVNFKTKAGWVRDSEVLLSGICNGFPAPLAVPPTQIYGKPTYTLVPANTATPTNTVPPANVNSSRVTQPTNLAPTNTLISPTQISVPPTNTLVPPTNTPVPPTDTPVPPTDTPVPPTNPPPTLAPPTATDVPPTNPPPTDPPPTDPPPPPTNVPSAP